MGNRVKFLEKAVERIEREVGKVTLKSSVYETAAWGNEEQAPFLNQALLIETQIPPLPLLKILLEIEGQLGRKRQIKFEARTIDIDILFYNDNILDEADLKVPHPAIQERRFVLAPLTEIAPQVMHPVLKKTIEQLLEECTDPLKVKVLQD